VRQLAQETRDETLVRLLNTALDLEKISQKLRPAEISEETREVFMDSNPPLPAMLVSFKRHDAIAGAFDDESQGMMEADPEPNFIAEINPGDPASVRQAFEALGVLCETMAAASRLAGICPGNNEEG
ncbi:MAG: hypothetical protein ACRD2O_12770, partial [Terriglobia bacterium]